MAEEKKVVVTARISPDLKTKLEKKAKEGYRTLSQEIEMRLLKSLEKSK